MTADSPGTLPSLAPAVERRRHARTTAPVLRVRFDGREHATVNWAWGGLVLEAEESRLAPGRIFTIDAVGGEEGELTSVLIRARVLRVENGGRRVAVGFLGLDRTAARVLNALNSARERARSEGSTK